MLVQPRRWRRCVGQQGTHLDRLRTPRRTPPAWSLAASLHLLLRPRLGALRGEVDKESQAMVPEIECDSLAQLYGKLV